MGFIVNKKKRVSKLTNIGAKRLSNVDLENTLYKPISEFYWKDATRSELHKEAIPHYSTKYAL